MLKSVTRKAFDLILIASLASLVGAFNVFLIATWFTGSGPANLGSIEVSYVSMAKFLVSNWPHLSWAPFWYLGFPFHLFYTPVLPVLVAILKVLKNVSFWHAYRMISGAGFVLGPVSLFFLVLYLSRNKIAALTSGILYSIMPSIFNFILPSGEVRGDSFTQEFLDPRRLVNLARWGEGPHTFSLIFLPLAGLFFVKALKERKPLDILLAAVFVALTALTNAVGLYALALLLAAIFIVYLFFCPKKRSGNFWVTVLTALFSYGLAAFWYNFSFIGTFFGESGGVLGNWLSMFPWGWFFLTGVVFIALFILKKFLKDKAISAVFLWTLSLFSIVAVYYFSAPSGFSEERIELAPQALRYMTEVDMGIAALVGLLIGYLAKKLSERIKVAGMLFNIVLGGLIVFACVSYGLRYAPVARSWVEAKVDLEETGEKKIADWLTNNVDNKKGERVFLAGNYGFYLNYFSDVWQLRGGLYQAMSHPWPGHIYYQMMMGRDPEIAQAWLKVINSKYIVVFPGSEYKVLEKFESLSLFASVDSNLIYEVPISNASPVKIVDVKGMINLALPKKADDKQPLLAYADWLEKIKTQDATFEKINNDLYKIKARVEQGEGVLVQMTNDKGWRATSPQGSIRILPDPLGFFVLIPSGAGEYEITLSHGRTLTLWFGYLVSLATIIFAAWYGLLKKGELKT